MEKKTDSRKSTYRGFILLYACTDIDKTFFSDNGLKVKWVWFRIEYQLRGTAHAHGCLRLIKDPGLIELALNVMTGRIAHRKLYGQTSARHGFPYANIKDDVWEDDLPSSGVAGLTEEEKISLQVQLQKGILSEKKLYCFMIGY